MMKKISFQSMYKCIDLNFLKREGERRSHGVIEKMVKIESDESDENDESDESDENDEGDESDENDEGDVDDEDGENKKGGVRKREIK